MAKQKAASNSNSSELGRSALLIENRENQLASLAFDLVEQRLRDGTATSQETTYFLKLVSSKTRYENELLATQNELAKAKADAIRKQDEMKEIYLRAMKAMSKYQGRSDDYNEELF